MRALVGIVVLLVASPAVAGRHGGGHGGGGHHRGGSSGGRSHSHRGHSHGYGVGYVLVPPRCVEKSVVLGYRTCSKFGAWDRVTRLPALSVDLMTVARAIRTAPLSLAGSATLEDQAFGYMAEAPGGTLGTLGLGLRVTAAVAPALHVGVEGEAGSVTASPAAHVTVLGNEPVAAARSSYGRVAGILGLHRDVGNTRLAAEVAAGVAVTPVVARFADDPEPGSEHETTLAWRRRATAEARIRIERWLSPWLTIGGFAGIEVSGRGASVGLSFGAHMRAFDGER